MNEVKLDIRKQVAKTNQAFTNYWGRQYVNGLLDEDTSSLERLLAMITRNFKIYKVGSIILSSILIALFISKYFSIINQINLNKSGTVTLCTLLFLVETYRSYKIKVNLENKIFLLRLLEKIDR